MSAALLLKEFPLVVRAPNGIGRIRELVHYFALSGGLSERRKGDSTAAEVVEDALLKKDEYLATSNTRRGSRKHAALIDIVRTHPSHWEVTDAGNLLDLINGRAFKSTEWNTSGKPIIRIQNLNDRNAPFNYFQGEAEERHHVQDGDMLLSWSGTPGTSFGAFIWDRGDAVLNQHIFKVAIFSELLDKRYLQLAINACLDVLIGSARGGVGLKHVTKGQIEAMRIPLPSLEEQKRIVAKVDELMGLCDRLELQLTERTKLLPLLSHANHARFVEEPTEERLPSIFYPSGFVNPDDMRSTVLSLAVSGRLVKQVEEEGTGKALVESICSEDKSPKSMRLNSQAALPFNVPTTWGSAPLGLLLEPSRIISYGIIKLGVEPRTGGVPVLRCSNVRYRRIDETGMRNVEESLSDEYARTILKGGELLINIRGTLGGCAIVPMHLEGANIAREVAVVPLHPTLNPVYVLAVVSSPYFQGMIEESLRGIAYRGLNLKALREFLIPIPPIEEQRRIVKKVDELWGITNLLEQFAALRREISDQFSVDVCKVFTEKAGMGDKMKPPNLQIRTVLRQADALIDHDENTLVSLLAANQKEMSAKSLWKQSGLEIDEFYRRLKVEIANGWIVEPEPATVREVEAD